MKRSIEIMMGCTMLIFSSCQHDLSQYSPTTNDAVASTFNFSTSRDIKIHISYDTKAAIPFAIYAQNPITAVQEEGGGVTNRISEDIKPLFTGHTLSDGTFSGTLNLASYASKLYVVSSAFFVQNVIEAEVKNGSATATESWSANAKTRGTRDRGDGYPTNTMINARTNFVKGWNCPLGTFDSNSGLINYGVAKDYSNKDLMFTDDQISNFYSAITAILNVNQECPVKYLTAQDLVVPRDETISMTVLGGNTCWNSSLGYYYYTGNTPSSKNNLKIFTLFPNTQDGKWTNGNITPVGLLRGTNILLKYYGSDYKGTGTTTFPQGTKIGFVLACNTWQKSNYSNFSEDFCSFTTPELSSDNAYTKYGNPWYNNNKASTYGNVNTAMMNYQDGTVIAFEDRYDDHNCTDVQFALKPQFGVNDTDNKIEELVTTNTDYTASDVYAFEDLWPVIGDYDMNDVLIYTTRGKTTQIDVTKDNNYYTTSEEFLFETDQNHSKRTALNNGLAAWINGTGLSVSVSLKAADASDYKVLDASKYTVEEENGKTYIYLDNNVKDNMGSTYKVTVNYGYAAKVSANVQTEYGCFIYRDDAGIGRWEVHIPYENPTSKLCKHYRDYLTADKPYAAIYSDANIYYPFAIKLTSAAKDKLDKLINADNETKRIDGLYTNYANWAKSNGINYTDWYNE